jgi:squalene-hopene/tetraprenyl-beta-curcumene cyclase
MFVIGSAVSPITSIKLSDRDKHGFCCKCSGQFMAPDLHGVMSPFRTRSGSKPTRHRDGETARIAHRAQPAADVVANAHQTLHCASAATRLVVDIDSLPALTKGRPRQSQAALFPIAIRLEITNICTMKAAADLEQSIQKATSALLNEQRADGHWVFELEADCTIPAEYVLLRHYLGEPVAADLEAKIAAYLRRTQGAHGGWPLFQDGDLDISATVKAYFALKMIGDSVDADHMRRAREAIRARGGAERANVFTRIMFALFGFAPWQALPVMPIEIMLLPKWFPFHLDKISYWSRTVIVPLLVLQVIEPRARNPKGVHIDELFLKPPRTLGPIPKAPQQKASWFWFFHGVDKVLRTTQPYFPKSTRKRALDRAIAWVTERLNGEDGLGAIFPAMANSVMMFDALGFPESHPPRAIARKSVEKLLVVHQEEAYCQPCVSPIWDTALTCQTLLEVGGERAVSQTKRGLAWLAPKQILDVLGDWIARRSTVRPGGWAFQYANPHYPDVDDTAVVAMAMDSLQDLSGSNEFHPNIARAEEWILGMQSASGAWGAFDADNEFHYLNNIPFADHGALLDPPTEDVTARCISMLAQFGETKECNEAIAKAINFLRQQQLPDGSWFGRWGMNYIYGTWSVLCAFNAAGVDHGAPEIRHAVQWLASIQNADGGWGEDGTSYKLDYRGYEQAPSTASQTAWALLALMAAGEVDHRAVASGLKYLADTQCADGFWAEPRYTATGFPRVFYLRYHGYSKYFPLWAMARYRNLMAGNTRIVNRGM